MTFADLTRRLAASLPSQLLPTPAQTESDGPRPLPAGSGGSRGPLAAMRHRNYRLFWIGQVLSLVGTWMQSVSEPCLVLLVGGCPLQVGMGLAPGFAPPLGFGRLRRVLAGRIDKRAVVGWT